jgi:hypothetical protein
MVPVDPEGSHDHPARDASTTKIAEEIDWRRRYFVGAAAVTAATQLGIYESANAQSSKTGQAQVPPIKPGTNTSFAPLKQIDAGVLNVAYAEAGPADGPAVVERINRKLAGKGQILMATRKMKAAQHFGDYYILDLSGNVMDTHIDPEKLARKLGVLKEGEKWSPSREELGQKAKPDRSSPSPCIDTGGRLSPCS